MEDTRILISNSIQTDNLIKNVIAKDWMKTGRCDFTTIKGTFLHHMASRFILQKNSPYTKELTLE